MEEFIEAMRQIGNVVNSNIIYKIENKKKLNDVEIQYLKLLFKEKKRREENVRK